MLLRADPEFFNEIGREQRSKPAGANVGLCRGEPSFDIGLSGSIGLLMAGSSTQEPVMP